MANGDKKTTSDRYRSYVNKDFNSFRSDLIQYAKTYFPGKVGDLSENSMGGLLVDLAAYIGDNLSFYLDHQFFEIDPETAVETQNIERLADLAGVKTGGASPASATVDFYILVPSEEVNGSYMPKVSYLPVIVEGTIVMSRSGVRFQLTHDIDFSETDIHGELVASYSVPASGVDSEGRTTSFIMKASGICVSGSTTIDTFTIPGTFQPFRRITLSNPDVSEIIFVQDSEGNSFYEVEALTQDVVFRRVSNLEDDSDLVPENLELIPAPRRFITSTSRSTRLSSLTFGSGNENTLDDDLVPDPSEIALPLYGKRTFSKFSIDPNSLLNTRTLGVSPINTVISVRYRHGGGLSHNVASESIVSVPELVTQFHDGVPSSTQTSIRASLEIKNPEPALGGENPISLEELRSLIRSFKNSQSRIVTKEDLIARIYTMPSNFGRVFRVGIRSNDENPLSSNVYIISRDSDGKLIVSPDNLKLNLRTYLNQFRLISDAVDILDATVVNFGISYNVVIDAFSNRTTVLQEINKSLKEYTNILNFQIDQPIIITDLSNIIQNVDGVVSLSSMIVTGISGMVDERQYSETAFNVDANTDRGIIIPPPGAIFEMRFPDTDIVGNSV